jgi:hypothetical protein
MFDQSYCYRPRSLTNVAEENSYSDIAHVI